MIPSERQMGNSGDFGDCREGVLPSSRPGDPCGRNGLRGEVLTGIAMRTSLGSNGPVHRRLAGMGKEFRQPCAAAGHDPETGRTRGEVASQEWRALSSQVRPSSSELGMPMIGGFSHLSACWPQPTNAALRASAG